ncbi:MAG: hypothetical protein CSA52_03720 [Gammaproteobacteria bacterium]|nr:MAG: hypothetical protein CSB48_06125 [Pseudomonadota bacterium]PIE38130.1 MAG: hypothetical protein CSA52_03720 [Gammaproteobacteria bacterium]
MKNRELFRSPEPETKEKTDSSQTDLIPILSVKAGNQTGLSPHPDSGYNNNPFLPYDTLARLATEREQFKRALNGANSKTDSPDTASHSPLPLAETTGNRLAETSLLRGQTNLELLIAQTAHEVFLDFLPAIQGEVLKRLEKQPIPDKQHHHEK